MKYLLLLALIVGSLGASNAMAQLRPVSYDDVMLIVNDRSWTSAEIGQFFAGRRNIPERNICHIDVDTSETMDSATFVLVKWQIEGWMREHNLTDSINYIVTTKGCPLRVRTSVWDKIDSLGQLQYLGGQSSFEDCLMLMNGADSTQILRVRTNFSASRYFGSSKHFRRDPQTLPMYLVTRLDAYTIDQVKGYIMAAEKPVAAVDGLWVLDVDPGRGGGYKMGNDWLFAADSVLRGRDLNVLLNTDTTYLHDQQGVLGYASWGSNDGHSHGGQAAKPGNTWVNGSIAETYVSTGGRSFMVGAGYGQSLIADWVAEGVSGIKGYTDEPYLIVMAEPHILFDRYTSGFNMAESFWSASPLIAWRQVVIGDPKMQLMRLLEPLADTVRTVRANRYSMLVDTARFYNTSGVDLKIDSITVSGKSLEDFTIAPLVGTAFADTLVAGDSLSILVSFAPRVYGDQDISVRVRFRRLTDQRYSTASADISGTGLRPTFTAPDMLGIPVPPGAASAVDTVTFVNSSVTDTLVIRKVIFAQISDPNARFEVDPSAVVPDTIPPGGSWRAGVVYTPTENATDTVTMNVYTTGDPSVQRIKVFGIGRVSDAGPIAAALSTPEFTGATPNPFALSSRLLYRLPARAHVRLDVLDPLGNVVTTLVDGVQEEGEHAAVFSGGTVASGTYLCRLVVAGSDGEPVTRIRSVVYCR